MYDTYGSGSQWANRRVSKTRAVSTSQFNAGPEDKTVKVGSWILLVNYLDVLIYPFRSAGGEKANGMCLKENDELESTSLPSRIQLHEMERRQCAHLENANKFAFDQTWDHNEINNYLQNEVFPVAFTYVNSKEKGKGTGDPSCPWVLISKERSRYDVVKIARPTGNDLARFRGRPKCPVKDANVIIGKPFTIELFS